MPVVPIDHLYSKCSTATVGHDFPTNPSRTIGKQMKIIASAPGAPIFKCALDTVIKNVRARNLPDPLLISGPLLLKQCYEKHSEDVAITYHDTREARWPYTGLRAGETILAFELPSPKSFGHHESSDYAHLFEQKKVYTENCPLLIEA